MIKATALTSLLSISIIASTTSFAASVVSVSKESFAQYGKEDAYWVISVNCDNDTQHVVQRKTDQNSWCPKGDDSLCSEDKDIAYKNACSDAYTQQSKKTEEEARAKRRAQKAAEAATEQRIQKKIAIQESLLRIEQKRLALSKRQLEIERRIIEINDLLKTENE